MPQPVTSVTGFAMTGFLQGSAVQGWAGRPGGRPLQRHSPIELRRGRCPHRPASVTRGTEERAGKSAKRRQWRMQRGDFEEVPRLAAATVAGNRLARRWAREPRPYGSATRGAIGGRPQGSPLRMGCKRCSGQATMRVDHTEAGLWGHEVFLFSCKFILEKQLGICYTLHYSGNKFLSA